VKKRRRRTRMFRSDVPAFEWSRRPWGAEAFNRNNKSKLLNKRLLLPNRKYQQLLQPRVPNKAMLQPRKCAVEPRKLEPVNRRPLRRLEPKLLDSRPRLERVPKQPEPNNSHNSRPNKKLNRNKLSSSGKASKLRPKHNFKRNNKPNCKLSKLKSKHSNKCSKPKLNTKLSEKLSYKLSGKLSYKLSVNKPRNEPNS